MEYQNKIGDPFVGAGIGGSVGALGGGLAGLVGGGLVGTGLGAVGGGLAGAIVGGATLGLPGMIGGGLLGAGVGGLNGAAVGAGIGAIDGAALGGLGGAVLGSMLFNESDFREFPDELSDQPLGESGLEVCSRGAFGIGEAIGEATNVEHWWLKDGIDEAGLGTQPLTWDPLDTTMNDQTGDSGADGVTCVPLEAMFPEHANVDLGCVEDMMTPGRYDFGEYGFGGICKDAVNTILEACDPDVEGAKPPLTGE